MDEIKIALELRLDGPDVNQGLMDEMYAFMRRAKLENAVVRPKTLPMAPDKLGSNLDTILQIIGAVGGIATVFQLILSFLQSGSSKKISLNFSWDKKSLLQVDAENYDHKTIEMLLEKCLEVRKEIDG